MVEVGGVAVHGPTNITSSLAVHASQMFSRNVENYLAHLLDDGELRLDLDDELVSGPLVTHGGSVANARVREALER